MANKYKIKRKNRTKAEKASARASFKTRTLTACFLLFIITTVILVSALPIHFGNEEVRQVTDYVFIGFVTLLAMIATYEIADVKAEKNKWDWEPFAMMFFIVPLLMFLKVENNSWEWTWSGQPAVSLPVIIIALSLAFSLPVFKEKYDAADSSYILANALLIAILFKGMIYIYLEIHFVAFISIMAIAVTTDTFAYLGGYMFGVTKLIPRISPKKTWEGAIIGTIFGTALGVFLFMTFKEQIFANTELHDDVKFSMLFIIPFCCSIASQIGDLIFSAIKRRWNIKDFSNIFPGHGGVLDRSDSIAGVIFVFLTFFTFIVLPLSGN